MASKPSLENRLSRMEAARPRRTAAEETELRVLRAMSTPDLRRLEGLMTRAESGDPGVALTAAEEAWIEETMKRAALAADG